MNEVFLRGERFILGRNLKLCEIEGGVEVGNFVVPYFVVFFGNFDGVLAWMSLFDFEPLGA